ncbi:pyridoxamine 5'-phosphate oxidase family protein [Novosphingobium mangrovi (ex Huang et al. 2023)]|uniref:TIGR03618 family F420-dependent PPOX class oxidoreductase n=1 Tax=Novosphingobium mangrovi (ex Huang et al. 2023) TaxID=2976432 RepID=A0ABT2I7G4_9SPHN|nr:TIGR03618 family F420-dependent PPOX class oxidoreductase [Novosphingobium mangrovi (ex Huang et al. 2023)]MCT2400733.1 TIGR03618 family F420-dependent PPOX class oxidoreductase [Novosphingobium mangrovi (ex Huang et al. 2023)]
MAKQRDAIRMSDEEIVAFMDRQQNLQVATIGKDGAPHLTTVWFVAHEGRILFETYGTSQKVVNLQRDPRLAVLAEDGTTYDTLRGVSINGRAEIIADQPRRGELMEVLIGHHFPGLSPEQLRSMSARMAEKRVVVAVEPEKVVSWDHTKLSGKGP